MFDVKRQLAAVAIGCLIAAGVFAQKKDDRPIKQPNTVVVSPKGEKPPPNNNNNRGGDNKKPPDKKGKG